MNIIRLSKLTKYFKVAKRSGGVISSFSSILNRSYDTVKAVDRISFSITEGELVGFIGPNGAGKTTTLKCLCGLLYPTQGEVSVLGYNPFERKPDFLKQISLIMGQKNQLWWSLPAIETFRLNKEIYEINESDFEKSLNELTTLLEVKSALSTPVRYLSLGQRMKMELIAVLLHKPKILFLDEPTIGLDVIMQKKIRDFISQYNKKFRATIILTSHYMFDVQKLCRRIIIIDHGKLVYDGNLTRLVEKYANRKIITVIFSHENIDEVNLSKLGTIKSYIHPKAVLTVPKAKTKAAATELLNNFPIEDLNIEEPEIDDVIRLIFSKKNK
ncbi:ABC transporter [Candidatus Gottesmanbacteria bacterium RBG_13_37_7]|uniref:ABC transporter n=1 Tax=Candidatus Gottesmanbacteria bacterium RBG_13_37_7 TaxID=1798369 RepID=A0A1F5YIY5_9BACT|nr:MAG: ABC transporter [Candidatus Gottesmanbacteria bacterium RBG_13_37_7]